MFSVHSAELHSDEKKDMARTLQELTLGVAHDVRNPLSAAQCLIALMRKRQTDDAAMQRYIEEMALQLDYAAEILTSFCNAYKPIEEEAEQLNIAYICRQTVSIFKGMATLKGVALRENYEFTGKFPVHAGCLSQILINFIKNAIDASDDGSVIVISVREEAKGLRVSVKDSGKGMDAAELKNIFAAYYTTKKHGTGLGLNISMHIAAACGWDIEAASEPGQGAEFSVILPRDAV